jgi:site-specific recombinase XerD
VLKLHGLRHGFATLALAAGVPERVVVKMMGHADTRILSRYQEVLRRLEEDGAQLLDAHYREHGGA